MYLCQVHMQVLKERANDLDRLKMMAYVKVEAMRK